MRRAVKNLMSCYYPALWDGKPSTLEQAADLLFGLMMVGDDRAIEQTWAMGRQVYLRRGSN